MRNILTSKMWQCFLVIAFLSMQSASAHIHLASSHDHDGHAHDHSRVIHAHNVASHHSDAFESDHDTQVVELGKDWIVKYLKWLSDLEPHAILISNFSFGEQSVVAQSYLVNLRPYHSVHFRSKVQARAPPILFASHV